MLQNKTSKPRDTILSFNPPADCTQVEVEQVIEYLMKLPLAELRERQTKNQMYRLMHVPRLSFEQQREAYRQLDARDEHLRVAIDRKEFPKSG